MGKFSDGLACFKIWEEDGNMKIKKYMLCFGMVMMLAGMTACGNVPEQEAGAERETEETVVVTEMSEEQETDTEQAVIDTSRPIERDDSTQIEIKSGSIVGGYVDDEKKVASWRGIPYAKAPVGELRWKAPVEPDAWDGILECTEWGNSAQQLEQQPFGVYTQEFIIEDTGYSEDCLNLNVWSDLSDDTEKPVLVYIHGGGFTTGGSSCEIYDGSYLAEQGIVVVSINYRLGIYGFFANSELVEESDENTAGNYAILDQIEALKWVNENIEQFGGDKNNVTIMGQSAGASAVNALIVSPKAAGLFEHAVSMSFNDYCLPRETDQWRTLEDTVAKNDEACEGYSLEQLRAMSNEELMSLKTASSRPCIDGVVLSESFADAIDSGKANMVDLMTGGVTGDVSLFGFSDEKTEKLSGVDIMSGSYQLLAQSYSEYNDNVYVYYDSHPLPGSTSAMHTSEVPYFMHVFSEIRQDDWTAEDIALGDEMSGYLINFCKYGNPNGTELPEWEKYDGTYSYMNFDAKAQMTKMDEDVIIGLQEIFSETKTE